jgi:[ribosomal protein S5]-alanine N-acetyltransferase
VTTPISIDTELISKRLRLRAITFSDIELVWTVSRFEGFNEGMVWDPPSNKEELTKITKKNIAA